MCALLKSVIIFLILGLRLYLDLLLMVSAAQSVFVSRRISGARSFELFYFLSCQAFMCAGLPGGLVLQLSHPISVQLWLAEHFRLAKYQRKHHQNINKSF